MNKKTQTIVKEESNNNNTTWTIVRENWNNNKRNQIILQEDTKIMQEYLGIIHKKLHNNTRKL